MNLEETLNNLYQIPKPEDFELIDVKQHGSNISLICNIENNQYLDIPKYIPEYFEDYNDVVVKESLLTVSAYPHLNHYTFRLFVVCENDEDSFGINWSVYNFGLDKCKFADLNKTNCDNLVIERENKDGKPTQVFYNGFETDLFKIYQPDDIINLSEDDEDDLNLISDKVYSSHKTSRSLYVPNDEMTIAVLEPEKALEFLGIADSDIDFTELMNQPEPIERSFSASINSMINTPGISLVSQDEIEKFEINGTTAYRKKCVLKGGGDTVIYHQVVTTTQDGLIMITLLNFPEGTKEEYSDYFQIMMDTMVLN